MEAVYNLTNVKKDKELSIINVTCYYLLLNTFDLICLFINIVNMFSLPAYLSCLERSTFKSRI